MQHITYMHLDVFAKEPLMGNGLVVFFGIDTSSKMQKLTQEMRQFESIFLEWDRVSREVSARIFTLDEEIDYAGHPLLGAASAMHYLSKSEKEEKWTFKLNTGSASVVTKKSKEGFAATLEQGVPKVLKTLTQDETLTYLEALNLTKEDLSVKAPAQVVSSGLPYLIIPLKKNLEKVKVTLSDLSLLLEKIGAKFTYVVDIDNLEARSWDNFGNFEDVATGSAAGPLGGYLVEHELAQRGHEILIKQGRFVNRPSEIKVIVEDSLVKVSATVVLIAEGNLLHY